MSTKKNRSARKILAKYTSGPQSLGRMVAALRQGEEENQKTFAKRLGVSVSYLSELEHDRKPVSAQRARDFAKRLGYSDKQFIRLALQDSLKRQGIPYTIEQLAA